MDAEDRRCAASRARRNFIASYNEAVDSKVATPQGVHLVDLARLSKRARTSVPSPTARARSYVPLIKRIERDFGDFPLAALTDRRTRGNFMAWRDKIAASVRRRQADYAWAVLARVLSWALNRGLVAANPVHPGGRLYQRLARRKDLDRRRRSRIPRTRAGASASAAAARAMDRATARRSPAPALVGL